MARIKNLRIKNYRCFENFEASFGDECFVVLIGRGDSGKSTILKAIDALLSPQWNYPFSDWDFYGGKVEDPIIIEGDIVDVPDEIASLDTIGFNYKLHKSDGSISSDLSNEEDGDTLALTIRLVVDDSLEPKWYIISGRDDVPDREIHSKERELFRSFFVEDSNESHFSFHRQSPLASLTQNSREERESLNHKMTAIIRGAFLHGKDISSFEEFDQSALKVKEYASKLGVPSSSFNAQLDFKENAFTLRNVGLHKDNQPCRLLGNGSRRLISMAIQLELTQLGGIVLVDEIEQGLEPDRILNIIKMFKGNKCGQMILTTHSPYVVCESTYNQLFHVKSDHTGLWDYHEDFAAVLRTYPELFFAKKVIACEGKTEEGFLRKMDSIMREKGDGFSLHGVSVANCKGGDKFYKVAISLRTYNVDICVFCDHDAKDIEKKHKEAEEAGCKIVRWEDGLSLEQQIFKDVCWETLVKLVNLAQELDPKAACYSQIGLSPETISNIANDTISNRTKIGLFAKKGSWFKNIDKGEKLSEIVYGDFVNGMILPESGLYKQLDNLTKWIQGA